MTKENDIGHAIRNARKGADLTQVELAKKLKVSQTTITHWENGANVPNVSTLQAISKITQTTFANLFGRSYIHSVYGAMGPDVSRGCVINKVEGKGVALACQYDRDVLVLYCKETVQGTHYEKGDCAIFDKQAVPPNTTNPNWRYLVEFWDGELAVGYIEQHPTNSGEYRVFMSTFQNASDWKPVRAVHLWIATHYAGEGTKLISQPKK